MSHFNTLRPEQGLGWGLGILENGDREKFRVTEQRGRPPEWGKITLEERPPPMSLCMEWAYNKGKTERMNE